jgi:hypothetical protein
MFKVQIHKHQQERDTHTPEKGNKQARMYLQIGYLQLLPSDP